MPTPLDILNLTHRVVTSPEPVTTTAELSRIAGYSEAHLHRAFRHTAAATPKTWLQRIQLARAAHLLVETDQPIHQIATETGFSSHESFTRAFGRVVGLTPTAARQNGRSAHLDRAPCLTLYHLSFHPRRAPMSVEISIVSKPAQPVLYMRKTVAMTALQQAMAECLPAVFVHCQQHGIAMAGPPFTRYVSMSRGRCTIEAGMPVISGEGAGEIHRGELPGGDLAFAVHQGPYDTLGQTHAAVEAWLIAQGRTASGGPWEVYVTDPGEVPNPADWRTDIYYPLA
ncbi:MAG: helix-turn-helix domain-containing protein [Myxococcota bacterium]